MHEHFGKALHVEKNAIMVVERHGILFGMSVRTYCSSTYIECSSTSYGVCLVNQLGGSVWQA